MKFNLLERVRQFGRHLLNQRGASTIEYVGMAAVAVAIVGSILFAMSAGGGADIGQAVADAIERMIAGLGGSISSASTDSLLYEELTGSPPRFPKPLTPSMGVFTLAADVVREERGGYEPLAKFGDDTDDYLLPMPPVPERVVLPVSWEDTFKEEARLMEEMSKFENEIADLERQISETHGLSLVVPAIRLFVAQKKLSDLEMQWNALQTRISNGIPSDGPTQDGRQRAGCVYYVSTKRDISEFSVNAPGMDEAARAADYEVGTRPVKGSIMVFEPNVLVERADNPSLGKWGAGSAGHVAYVEEVIYSVEEGCFLVTVTSGSVDRYSDGRPKYNTFIGPDTITLKMEPSGNAGVSFIYDKKG